MADQNPKQLIGWKAIERYWGLDKRTIQRMRRDHAGSDFPVVNVGTGQRGHVEANTDQIDEFRRRQAPIPTAGNEGIGSSEGPASSNTFDNAGAVEVSSSRAHLARSITFSAVVAGVIAIAAIGVSTYRFLRPSLKLTVDTMTVKQGETINFEVHGFNRDASIIRSIRAPNGVESVARNVPLLADVRGQMKFSFSPDCGTPTGNHSLWVVDEKSNLKSNVIIITVGPEPRCSGPLPDLVAEQLSVVAPPTLSVGQTMVVSITIRNTGTAVAQACDTRIRLSTSRRSAASDTPLFTVQTPMIDVDAAVSRTIDVPVPAVPPGLYYVTAYVDYRGKILEISYENNVAIANQQIAIVSPMQ